MQSQTAIHNLFKLVKQKGASDLFITSDAPPSFKVLGSMQPITKTALTPERAKSLVFSIMTDEQIQELENTKECNFAVDVPDVARFRVSAFQQRNQYGLVARIIVSDIPPLETLRAPEILKSLSLKKKGLVLVVGGTGSGKSTTLNSMLDYRNHHSGGHIISIEDPIEFLHRHDKCLMTQREVGIDTASFEVALKNALRQAPDILLIGEIRSQQTMEYALTFAETGHLCLATLHANTASQALDRIKNFFQAERHTQLFADLATNLLAIIAQNLVKTNGGKGRVLAAEILVNSPSVSDKIHKGAFSETRDLMLRDKEYGMQTIEQALFRLIQEERITLEEALPFAMSPNELRLMCKFSDDSDEPAEDTDSSLSLIDIAE